MPEKYSGGGASKEPMEGCTVSQRLTALCCGIAAFAPECQRPSAHQTAEPRTEWQSNDRRLMSPRQGSHLAPSKTLTVETQTTQRGSREFQIRAVPIGLLSFQQHSDDANLKVGMNIKVIVEPGEDGYFVAHVPALKSCWSQGKTRDEAIQNIREAIDLYLEPEPEDLADDQELVELTV